MCCGHGSSTRVIRTSAPARAAQAKTQPQPLIVKKSESKDLVKLRYYGAGMGYVTDGCHSCGASGQYALKTSETIQFPSDDAPGGWFSKRFDSSYDYFVTEKQAEYLLSLTYNNPAGQTLHKFRKVE